LKIIGNEKCPVVDNPGGKTETGRFHDHPAAFANPKLKPLATRPFFGVQTGSVDNRRTRWRGPPKVAW